MPGKNMALPPAPPFDEWTPASWQTKPARQQPVYPDPEAVRTRLALLYVATRSSPVGNRASEILLGDACAVIVSSCKAVIALRPSLTANLERSPRKLKSLLQMAWRSCKEPRDASSESDGLLRTIRQAPLSVVEI